MEQFLYYIFYYKITHILDNVEITAIFFIKRTLFLIHLYLTFT